MASLWPTTNLDRPSVVPRKHNGYKPKHTVEDYLGLVACLNGGAYGKAPPFVTVLELAVRYVKLNTLSNTE